MKCSHSTFLIFIFIFIFSILTLNISAENSLPLPNDSIPSVRNKLQSQTNDEAEKNDQETLWRHRDEPLVGGMAANNKSHVDHPQSVIQNDPLKAKSVGHDHVNDRNISHVNDRNIGHVYDRKVRHVNDGNLKHERDHNDSHESDKNIRHKIEQGHSHSSDHTISHKGNHFDDHDDNAIEHGFGKGKAIVAVEQNGARFQLTKQAEKMIGIRTEPLKTISSQQVQIPSTALVRFQDQSALFLKQGEWFVFISISNYQLKGNSFVVPLKAIPQSAQVVTAGVPLLRIAHLQASGQGGRGHAH